MLYRGNYNDVKNIVEISKELIKENKFYFDYKDGYELYNEEYVKKLLDKGDIILLYEENGKIVGISHWSIMNEIYFNEYTGVINGSNGKGIAKQFYYYFLNKEYPVGAEFIVYTEVSAKLFKIWYEKGTKIYGFSPSQQYYNNTNHYSTILGFRPSENKIKLKIPEYSEEFIKKLCILNNLDCKIYTIKEKRGKNKEDKGKIYITDDPIEYERFGYYLTGFMFNNGKALYYYSNKIDKDGIKNIGKFFEDIKGKYFEEAKSIIFSYIDKLNELG